MWRSICRGQGRRHHSWWSATESGIRFGVRWTWKTEWRQPDQFHKTGFQLKVNLYTFVLSVSESDLTSQLNGDNSLQVPLCFCSILVLDSRCYLHWRRVQLCLLGYNWNRWSHWMTGLLVTQWLLCCNRSNHGNKVKILSLVFLSLS